MINLNHSQLAKAIECVTKLNLEDNVATSYWNNEIESYIFDKISIDQHLSITIPFYKYNYVVDEGWCLVHSITLYVYIYVDNIAVNFYYFNKELQKDRTNYNIWELESKKTYHKLPDIVIQKINDWSYDVVKNNKTKIYMSNKLKFDIEEQKLSKIFKEYKKEQ